MLLVAPGLTTILRIRRIFGHRDWNGSRSVCSRLCSGLRETYLADSREELANLTAELVKSNLSQVRERSAMGRSHPFGGLCGEGPGKYGGMVGSMALSQDVFAPVSCGRSCANRTSPSLRWCSFRWTGPVRIGHGVGGVGGGRKDGGGQLSLRGVGRKPLARTMRVHPVGPPAGGAN